MKNYKSFIALFFILVCVTFIFLFRQVPSSQFWEGYSVLYVPVDTPDEIVIKGFEESGITDYISLSKQFVPMKMIKNSPEYSMFMMNRQNPEFSYLYERNNYFYDKDNLYRIYYIPVENKQKFTSLIKYLNHWNVSGNIDSKTSYPWIIVVVCSLLAGILAYLSKKRTVFISGVILPLFFIGCNPFYPTAIASCLLMLVLLFISNLWNRKNAVDCLLKNYFIAIVILISVLCGFSTGIISGIQIILLYGGIVSVLYLYNMIEKYFESKLIFSPVYIRPAKMISVFSGKTFIILNSVLISMLILVCSFVFTNRYTSSNENIESGKIYFPVVSSTPNIINSENNLPTLEDYYRWTWNVTTYPYKSINSSEDYDSFVFPHYTQQGNEIVLTEDLFVYDEEYKNSIYNQIDELGFNSIEQLLKSQNTSIFPSYASSGAVKTGVMYSVMCFICVFILLFLYISIMIKKGVRK